MTATRWNGWGDPEQAVTLPDQVRELLAGRLGRPAGTGADSVAREQVQLPAPRLAGRLTQALADAVGATHVSVDDAARLGHTRGKSTVDLLRIRAGDVTDAPDAVVRPGSHDEVVAVLDFCSRERVAVVPFGGGTSVVGGLAADRTGFAGVISLDLARLNRLTTVDPISRMAVLDAGLTGPAAERLLGEHGFTLGHLPQSFEYATIGGFAATRSSGQYSLGYGRFDEMVMALTVATPRGTVETGRAPRSAAGPDLRQLFLGSEGAFGVITSVAVAIRPVPVERHREAWRFPGFAEGVAAVRALAQSGPRPTMARLSDETETAVIGVLEGRSDVSGCLAVIAYEDEQAVRDADGVRAVLAGHGGTPLGEESSADWSRSRFRAPYLRDALLDAGVFAETLETATFWSGLAGLREVVRERLVADLPEPIVLCHVSHVYPAGAALYFTIVCARPPDAVARWTRAKDAVTRAIVAAGGTVTHHHGVGRDHAAGLAEEVGPVALSALRAVKAALDPAGILNPGILLATVDSG